MRIIQLSDIHVWRYSWNPLRLMSKRTVGIVSLMAGRAKKFRLERLIEVIERVKGLEPDHVLISGDLTTTALPGEFADARAALAPLLDDPSRVTVIPGNHDRYTTGSVRHRHFEQAFGEFMPKLTFPWLRPIDARTAILGLDATRSHLSATGRLPLAQLDEARSLVADPASRPRSTDRRVPLPSGRPAGLRGRVGREADEERRRGPGLAVDARPAYLLLRPRPRRLGV